MLDNDIDMDAMKNVSNVYVFVTIVKAYVGKWRDRVRGVFGRGLRKEEGFWGLGPLSRIYEAIKNRTMPVILPCAPIETRLYTFTFLHQNP